MNNRHILFVLLLLWGVLHSNSSMAVSNKVYKIQKLILNDGDSLRGYIKKQIVGEEFITFCTDSGDRTILLQNIKQILTDIDSEDNIYKLKRRYTLTDGDTIEGRYLGEIPGKSFFVETDGGKEVTINRSEVKEWSLSFSQLKIEDIPILDKVTVTREAFPTTGSSSNKGFFSKAKRGLVVCQNFCNEGNFLRIMLDDGGFETIRIRDIDKLEKEGNDKYVSPPVTFHSGDSCVVYNKHYGFVRGEFRKRRVDELNIIPLYDVNVDFTIPVLINNPFKIGEVNSIEIWSLKPRIEKRRGNKIKFVEADKPVMYEIVRYDEYTNVSELNIIFKINDFDKSLGFVLIDKENKRFIPFMFSSRIR